MRFMIRINKYLASLGVDARRKIDEMIVAGRIKVNGKRVALGTKIDPDKDEILVDGKRVKASQKLIYIAFNKPKGVTSTVSDSHAQKTVMDLVRVGERVFPVGRLDVNSQGLMLLTNDGELANRLIHPRYHVAKKYEVLIGGKVRKNTLERLRRGVILDGERTAPIEVEVSAKGGSAFGGKVQSGKNTLVEMVLYEGRKRQIRRMCASLHLFVIYLKRVAIGQLALGELEEGEWRNLANEEVIALKKAVGV